ncbi:MAG TPA: hypothetical protein VJN71_01600, partial [Nitrososphaerales archaeon]|nr:hypothetical protein [Nitrososphaerales archaeon]
KLYRAKFADVRPLSGHTCSLVLFMSLLRRREKIVTCPPEFGGYPGSSEMGLGGLLSLRNLYFPYDPEAMNIIPRRTRKLIQTKSPNMVVFGSSFIPFPYEISESLPSSYTGYRVYDGSHVMGLIAGGGFQDPLREGCQVLMGSTHKTFFGPQGGLLLSNDEDVFSKIDTKVYPGIIDNIHWNRVAGLCFAMIELLKFGREYANQVVRNSKALALALHDLGVPVKCADYGFTKSHQVLLGFNEKDSVRVANRLEECDVISDTGIRLGTSEVTRRGMKEGDMNTIADIISSVVKGSNSKEKSLKQVHKFVSSFSGLKYTLP